MVGSSCLDLFLFDRVFGMDKDPLICPSTELDMISKISESASPASIKASMLTRKLAIMYFWSQKVSVEVREIWRNCKNVNTDKGYKKL